MLLSALVLGLLGSFHCVGMCGPIAFMLPVDRSNSFKKVTQISLYHFGRLISYSIIGLVFGLLGKGLYIFGLQQQLSIIIGILMIIVVIIPYNTFNKYNFSKPLFKLISKIKSALGKELKKKSPDTFLTIGFLNGFFTMWLSLYGCFRCHCNCRHASRHFVYVYFWFGYNTFNDHYNIHLKISIWES